MTLLLSSNDADLGLRHELLHDRGTNVYLITEIPLPKTGDNIRTRRIKGGDIGDRLAGELFKLASAGLRIDWDT